MKFDEQVGHSAAAFAVEFEKFGEAKRVSVGFESYTKLLLVLSGLIVFLPNFSSYKASSSSIPKPQTPPIFYDELKFSKLNVVFKGM